MQTPILRAAGACLVLGVYYWILLASPRASPSEAAEARLQQDIESSQTAFAAGDFATALAPTERVSEAVPTEVVYLTRLASIYRELARPADEATAWDRVIELSPTPIDACPMVAEAHESAGHADLALAALERCATFEPIDPDFLLLLGQALLQRDRPAEARVAFARGLERDAQYPDLHLLHGVRQFADGELDAAKVSFERFLELAPDRRDEVAVWLDRVKDVK